MLKIKLNRYFRSKLFIKQTLDNIQYFGLSKLTWYLCYPVTKIINNMHYKHIHNILKLAYQNDNKNCHNVYFVTFKLHFHLIENETYIYFLIYIKERFSFWYYKCDWRTDWLANVKTSVIQMYIYVVHMEKLFWYVFIYIQSNKAISEKEKEKKWKRRTHSYALKASTMQNGSSSNFCKKLEN